MTAKDEADTEAGQLYSAERAKAFIDAVVAIAMTLLILPLMESVGEAASSDQSTVEWWNENTGALFAFVLSFAVIGNFWVSHHRQFAGVTAVTNGLLWLTMAWMLTIVWLPIATAVVGQLETDTLQKVLYIGSMLITSLLMLFIQLYLTRHPQVHRIPDDRLRAGLRVDLILVALFAVALIVAVAVPAVSYYAMFLLLLTSPIQRLTSRRTRDR
ncbi:TMEM175 family protein [Microbacterium sp. P01]|uniref:TMEM175 family protein n=1 Tax=Microbacterium sp. P01 TaxID=3366261 RepID=UPI00366AF48B